jgi:hypothetical protein
MCCLQDAAEFAMHIELNSVPDHSGTFIMEVTWSISAGSQRLTNPANTDMILSIKHTAIIKYSTLLLKILSVIRKMGNNLTNKFI